MKKPLEKCMPGKLYRFIGDRIAKTKITTGYKL
jgi:hypothetical protein